MMNGRACNLICFLFCFYLSLDSTGLSQVSNEKYPTGLIFEPANELDKFKITRVFRSHVPPRRDLTSYLPRPGRQMNGSCVGWAIAYAARSLHYAWDNKVAPHLSENIASPAALYNSMYGVTRNDCSLGSNMSVALDFMKEHGVPSLKDFSNNRADQCSRVMDENHFKSAERFRIRDWRLVYPRKNVSDNKEIMITRIREQIAQYRPVPVALFVPDNWHGGFRHKGVYNNIGTYETDTGHAVTLVGYDDNIQAFKLINSWGKNWGDNGYLWISYDALKEILYAAYVMETRSLSPRPKPKPEPEPKPDPLIDDAEIVQNVLDKYECADVFELDEKNKILSAFAQSESDQSRLSSELEGRLDGYEIFTEVAPWPQCEVRITLKNQIANTDGLELSLNDFTPGGPDPQLREQDPLVLKIRTPDYPSYLYVAYLAIDKDGKHEATHLVQSTDVLKQYPPRTEIVLGDGSNDAGSFEIAGPNFGKEMIILIASASPLYEAEREWEEVERDYLSGIRDALIRSVNDKSGRQISAKILTLTTTPK